MKRMKLVIPYYRQQTDYTCGPASLRMALAYFRVKKTEKSLARLLKTNSKIGTRLSAMVVGAKKFGLFYLVKERATIRDIKHFTAMKKPVIINFIEPTDNEIHYSVVCGFDRFGLLLNDPCNGKNFHLTNRELRKRWIAPWEKRKVHQWMLVLGTKNGGS